MSATPARVSACVAGALLLLSAMAAASAAHAQQTRDGPAPPDVRVQSDTVMRWTSRYSLTVESSTTSTSTQYWRRIDQLPLYTRLSLDATHLAGDHVDVHIGAWAGLDIRLPDDPAPVAGDFGVAWAEGRLGPFSVWGGRRFVAWGPPGGLHVDGGGLTFRLPSGFGAELMVGRPVTPSHESAVGAQMAFEGPTGAAGARAMYADPGKLALSLSYVQRWAEGILADRTLGFDGTWAPHPLVDVRGNVAVDLAGVGVEQAGADVLIVASRELLLDVAYAHVDPRRLLPSWSILSGFASSLYEEGAVGATWRALPSLSLRTELALRVYHVPGGQIDDDPDVGYRADAVARYAPHAAGGTQLLARLSRRDDGTLGYTLLTITGAWRLRPIDFTAELAGAIDDERERDTALARLSVEVPISANLRVGGTFDAARTAVAESELRGLIRVSYAVPAESRRP